jgi:16S rRNA (guanine1207-N2)-methyltransferase
MISVTIRGEELLFETHDQLFSPKHPDEGTLLMLSRVNFEPDDIVLDLGCGWGLVGTYAARKVDRDHVYMTDKDPLAVEVSLSNLKRNGIYGAHVVQGDAYSGIDRSDFTCILSNPPYHTDFSVAKVFIEKGFNRLAVGGRLYMVTKRKEWYKQKIISVFGGVQIHEENGYNVFMAEKRNTMYARRK